MFYELTLRHDNPETGKSVQEKYIVKDCEIFAEAECKGLEMYNGECDVTAIRRSQIREFVNDSSKGELIFYATIVDVFLKDDGTEKELVYNVAVWANDIAEAQKTTKEYMEQGLNDMKLKGINQTKFIDVI